MKKIVGELIIPSKYLSLFKQKCILCEWEKTEIKLKYSGLSIMLYLNSFTMSSHCKCLPIRQKLRMYWFQAYWNLVLGRSFLNQVNNSVNMSWYTIYIYGISLHIKKHTSSKACLISVRLPYCKWMRIWFWSFKEVGHMGCYRNKCCI